MWRERSLLCKTAEKLRRGESLSSKLFMQQAKKPAMAKETLKTKRRKQPKPVMAEEIRRRKLKAERNSTTINTAIGCCIEERRYRRHRKLCCRESY